MSNRTSYEGETQRLPDYSVPPEDLSIARSDDALAYAPAPPTQPHAHPGHAGRKTGPLIGLAAIAIGVALFANSGRLPISGGFIERTTSFADTYAAGKLALNIGNGNVTLSRATGDEIEVEAISHGYGWTPGAAEQAAARVAPEISVAGDTLRIEEDRFNALNLFGRSPYVEYHIAVPDNIDASVSTGSGDLEVADIAGAIELKTGSGNVKLRNGQGSLRADTGSGDITVEGTSGELQASTGSGNIGIDGVSGQLSADAGSGDIDVAGAEAVAIQLHTGSGNIDFAGSLQSEGRHSIDTGSGNIELELPEDADVDLTANTGSGEIGIDDAWNAEVAENSASARLGSGGAELELRTSSGNISVEAD